MIPAYIIANTVSYGGPSEGHAVCGSVLECLLAQIGEPSVVMVALSGVLLVLMMAGHIAEALDVVETEIERTDIEQTAFEVFADRVAVMDVERPNTSLEWPQNRRVTADGGTANKVLDTYRETVMAVPHYESEYDEPPGKNMAAEFGEEVAIAVLGTDTMSAPLQQALVSNAEEAAWRRGEFLDTVEKESARLRSLDEDLTAIVDELEAIQSGNHSTEVSPEVSLDRLETRCETLLCTRQNHIHDDPVNRQARYSENAPNLQEYLYSSLSITYPVLSTVTDILTDVRTSQRTIVE